MPLIDATLPKLPDDCLVHILRHCDEPTRDCAMRASRQMKAATDLARRLDYTEIAKRRGRWTKEILPTAIELADRGCPKPNWKHIAQTMGVPMDGVRHALPLSRFYQLAIGLADAQKEATKAMRNTVNSTAKAYLPGLMERLTRAHGKMGSQTARACTPGPMDAVTKADSKTESRTAQACTRGPTQRPTRAVGWFRLCSTRRIPTRSLETFLFDV